MGMSKRRNTKNVKTKTEEFVSIYRMYSLFSASFLCTHSEYERDSLPKSILKSQVNEFRDVAAFSWKHTGSFSVKLKQSTLVVRIDKTKISYPKVLETIVT